MARIKALKVKGRLKDNPSELNYWLPVGSDESGFPMAKRDKVCRIDLFPSVLTGDFNKAGYLKLPSL